MTKIILILTVFLSNLIIASETGLIEPSARFTVTYQPFGGNDQGRTQITVAFDGEVYLSRVMDGNHSTLQCGLHNCFELDGYEQLLFNEGTSDALKAKVTAFFTQTGNKFMYCTIFHKRPSTSNILTKH